MPEGTRTFPPPAPREQSNVIAFSAARNSRLAQLVARKPHSGDIDRFRPLTESEERLIVHRFYALHQSVRTIASGMNRPESLIEWALRAHATPRAAAKGAAA